VGRIREGGGKKTSEKKGSEEGGVGSEEGCKERGYVWDPSGEFLHRNSVRR